MSKDNDSSGWDKVSDKADFLKVARKAMDATHPSLSRRDKDVFNNLMHSDFRLLYVLDQRPVTLEDMRQILAKVDNPQVLSVEYDLAVPLAHRLASLQLNPASRSSGTIDPSFLLMGCEVGVRSVKCQIQPVFEDEGENKFNDRMNGGGVRQSTVDDLVAVATAFPDEVESWRSVVCGGTRSEEYGYPQVAEVSLRKNPKQGNVRTLRVGWISADMAFSGAAYGVLIIR